jgi:hypothetical protein
MDFKIQWEMIYFVFILYSHSSILTSVLYLCLISSFPNSLNLEQIQISAVVRTLFLRIVRTSIAAKSCLISQHVSPYWVILLQEETKQLCMLYY